MDETWTASEALAVAEFRKMMRNDTPDDIYEDEYYFYRFLKARNFNMKQAEAMFRKHLRWRKEIQFEYLHMDFQPYEVLEKYTSQEFIGFDKTGCPVTYSAIGNLDGKGMFKSANKFDIFRYCLIRMEKLYKGMLEHNKMIGKRANQFVLILDMENITLAKATHRSSIESFKIGIDYAQNNYPEIVKKIYIINASSYFTLAFTIIKVILSGDLLRKMSIYGKNFWKDELLKHVDADVLPAFLGGQRTDPDGNPKCETFICHSGTIPERYYLTKDVQNIASKQGVQFVTVQRLSRFIVPVLVTDRRTVINWEYEIVRHDVGFGLRLEGTDQSLEESYIIPVYRNETEYKSETGKYRCTVPGNYEIIFDNSYSWFHSKEIYYRTWLTCPTSKSVECGTEAFEIDT